MQLPKLFPNWRARAKLLVLLGAQLPLNGACGYQPAYGGQRPEARLSVVPAHSRVPQLAAIHSVVAGVRQELGRAGVLGGGEAFPRLRVEVLRVDERSSGVLGSPGPEGDIPLARGAAVAVVARAWVEERDGSVSSDTGDVRRVETYAADPDVRVDALRRDEAIRLAAREVGRALGRVILGEPEPAMVPY